MDEQFEESGIDGVGSESASCYFGDLVSNVPGKATEGNPTSYIDIHDPPYLIQHGTIDDRVPVQQSIDFANELKMVMGEENVVLEIIDGAGHNIPDFTPDENYGKDL